MSLRFKLGVSVRPRSCQARAAVLEEAVASLTGEDVVCYIALSLLRELVCVSYQRVGSGTSLVGVYIDLMTYIMRSVRSE